MKSGENYLYKKYLLKILTKIMLIETLLKEGKKITVSRGVSKYLTWRVSRKPLTFFAKHYILDVWSSHLCYSLFTEQLVNTVEDYMVKNMKNIFFVARNLGMSYFHWSNCPAVKYFVIWASHMQLSY